MSISKAGLYIKRKHYGGIKGGIHNFVVFCQESWLTPAYEMCFQS